MEPSYDFMDRFLDKLAASTRSPRGRYSASESWKLLERRITPRKARWPRLLRWAGAAAASVIICVAGWYAYDAWQPATWQTVSSGTKIAVVTLPDCTKVTLNRHSSLVYPDRFKTEKREVHLEGEAYFEVEKDTLHPFVVKADRVAIQVLGTHFNVDAYPEDKAVRTTLLEGSVAVSVAETESRLVLSPGESVVYRSADQTLCREAAVRTDETVLWRDGRFHFDNLPLREIVRELSNAFHIRIRIEDERLEDFRIRAHFAEDEPLDQILDLLQEVGHFRCVKTNDEILIRSKLD